MEDWYSVPGIVEPADRDPSMIERLAPHLGPSYSAAVTVSIKPKSFAFRAAWKIVDDAVLIGECRIKYLGKRYSAFLYFNRSTEPRGNAPAVETMKLICPPIENIGPGSPVVLQLRHTQIICI